MHKKQTKQKKSEGDKAFNFFSQQETRLAKFLHFYFLSISYVSLYLSHSSRFSMLSMQIKEREEFIKIVIKTAAFGQAMVSCNNTQQCTQS